MQTIAVDAMGGDHAPKAEVEGAVRAARSLEVKVVLVGQEGVIRQELAQYEDHRSLPIEIAHAPDVVTMEDSAARAVRNKPNSSLRVASRMVKNGLADGLVSAGNTGAVMATAKIVQGVVPGVDRPALAGVFPTMNSKPVVVVDVGANVDCPARQLAQFAVMAEIYSRMIIRSRPNPRVGILSIGEEEHKGNDLTRAAASLLRRLDLNFIGNVEGRDIYSGDVDVIVCDGFVGNVALKVSEGVVDLVKNVMRESLEASITGKIGYAIAKNAFTAFRKRLDYSEYGGAPLLGVRGVCIICHGRSNANAIRNAIRVAKEFSEGQVNQLIERELARSSFGENGVHTERPQPENV
ncbi:MAG TPA: phosphate acyltransferase PlsX [Bryobacteraceae bacterium]|nr:phosphate acyltransferase PlsX [Bryobacteraceae bacterium]